MTLWPGLTGPWRRAYLALTAAVVLISSGFAANGRFSGDAFRHAATVDRLAESITRPANPMILGDEPDPGFSPYAVVLGLLSRATGLSGIDLLPVAGIVLMLVLLALLPGTARALVADVRAAPIALLLTLLAWGIQPWRWSGYLSLNSFGFGLGYPSLASWCALLAAVTLAARAPDDPRALTTLALGALLAFIALTHPITLVGAVPLVSGVVLGRAPTVRRAFALAGIVAVGVGLVAVWPLFSAFDLLGAGGEAFDANNRAVYDEVLPRTFLALPGVLALVGRARRNLLDPLVLAAGFGAIVFVAGYASERWTAGRSLPFVLFAAHLALAGWFAERLTDPQTSSTTKRCLGLGLAGLCTVGLIGCAGGALAAVPRSLLPTGLADEPRLASEADAYAFLSPFGGDRAVLVTADRDAARAALAYGFRSLHAPYPAAREDANARADARNAYLYGDERVRSRLVDEYEITHVLVRSSEGIELPAHRFLARQDGYELYLVPSGEAPG